MSDSSNIRRGYFDGPHGQVHFRACGPEHGEPLLLLHQSPLSSAQFAAVLPLLGAQGFAAMALDLPGFGMSDPNPEPDTLPRYAAIIPAALRDRAYDWIAGVRHRLFTAPVEACPIIPKHLRARFEM